ncbi:divergent PAP2 family protein [Tuanshanicoccus lijuaniae]|uniref:divergent PAP2 family protein n=1 Tax=Aerococcaceae bacterium zg-1292 TaxID=2774330 RepID=UPI00193594E3|nr:divergent PAP2 family protein [Aerococcaceae bacterium zg-1292]MBF6626788.1 divergent PAP2 family protein [Aerococcaceae bacterium zg-BR9]MBF6978711.1 divergent PAP2 family protein [Aerococcaceae bacterium zg-BR22]MBS4456837.1 divergent PAP2 family protein [Aerococcaceae bacterium zg-A91]MBS4458685.1 divergent PAP2 family protein [Aerococcaceae bacterium zg-BR33]
MNFPLITAMAAIIFTQLIKYPIAKLFNKSRANIDIVTSTGGMPSSHSAATSSLITALILQYGIHSPYVAIATVFGVIVMFDSMGVRRQSGEQGLILDQLAKAHLKHEATDSIGDYHQNEYQKMIIKKYLGHKPSEVIGGVITGIILAIILYRLFGLALELQ